MVNRSTRTFLAMAIFSEAWKRQIQEKRTDPNKYQAPLGYFENLDLLGDAAE